MCIVQKGSDSTVSTLQSLNCLQSHRFSVAQLTSTLSNRRPRVFAMQTLVRAMYCLCSSLLKGYTIQHLPGSSAEEPNSKVLLLSWSYQVCVYSVDVGVTVRVVELHSSEAELVHVEAQLLESLLWRDQPKTLHPWRAGEQMGEK